MTCVGSVADQQYSQNFGSGHVDSNPPFLSTPWFSCFKVGIPWECLGKCGNISVAQELGDCVVWPVRWLGDLFCTVIPCRGYSRWAAVFVQRKPSRVPPEVGHGVLGRTLARWDVAEGKWTGNYSTLNLYLWGTLSEQGGSRETQHSRDYLARKWVLPVLWKRNVRIFWEEICWGWWRRDFCEHS